MEIPKMIKIFTLSDMSLCPSGVGMQTRYMIEGLLSTGKYQVISFGGALKHASYEPIKTEEWGDDWIIFPVDGYGTQESVRSVLRVHKPDVLWFMTDPRFWGWLWEMEDEIRPAVPMIYYHVWDNYPYPTYNERFYASNDLIVTISKVTNDIVKNVTPYVDCVHHTHAVNTEVFKKFDDDEIDLARMTHMPDIGDKFLFFWNNRNARRKQSGSLIFWFKEFLDKVGHDKAVLMMHTEPKDQNGQDLHAIVRNLGLTEGQVLFSTQKVDISQLAMIYNCADCTINVSDAEGFGLGTLESLSCETPIIATMTGGLQEQVTDGENWFGIGIEPASKAIIGSQEIPWIYEDRLNGDDVVNALHKIYSMSKEERKNLGKLGRAHVEKNHSFSNYVNGWDAIFTDVHLNHGSWNTRKKYTPWTVTTY